MMYNQSHCSLVVNVIWCYVHMVHSKINRNYQYPNLFSQLWYYTKTSHNIATLLQWYHLVETKWQTGAYCNVMMSTIRIHLYINACWKLPYQHSLRITQCMYIRQLLFSMVHQTTWYKNIIKKYEVRCTSSCPG